MSLQDVKFSKYIQTSFNLVNELKKQITSDIVSKEVTVVAEPKKKNASEDESQRGKFLVSDSNGENLPNDDIQADDHASKDDDEHVSKTDVQKHAPKTFLQRVSARVGKCTRCICMCTTVISILSCAICITPVVSFGCCCCLPARGGDDDDDDDDDSKAISGECDDTEEKEKIEDAVSDGDVKSDPEKIQ